MKRIYIIITAFLLLCLCGCASDMQLQEGTGFYYPQTDLLAQQNSAGFVMESKENIPTQDIALLINAYLLGPEDPRLYCPITGKTELLDFELADNTLVLVFSDGLSQVSPHHITLSCTALAATVFHLTDISEIAVRCENAQLNGKAQLVFTPDTIEFIDRITTDIITETEVTE